MRIVIDLQGAQSSGSRNRGIGRYSTSLALGMCRNRGEHEILLALNGAFAQSVGEIREEFADMLPADAIRVFYPLPEVNHLDDRREAQRNISAMAWEAFLASLDPDVVHVSSLFEGLSDDAVTSIGVYGYGQHQTAVTLYDLIPLINQERYLENPVIDRWYRNKIDHLSRADLLLSISESSRSEGLEYLGFSDGQIVNISTAADPQFKRVVLSEMESVTLREKHGLNRPFIMYTGGIDYRKNIEGLIEAYALLPRALRKAYALAVVCSCRDEDRFRLLALGQKAGLDQGDLIMTGFVSEPDLIGLYSSCSVFVFPSWHEGFGLPALEAMCCGAPVIASDRSSLPEVVGWDEAMFDPFDNQSIADKLELVLTDGKFSQALIANGEKQLQKFSWDRSAQLAIAALERLHSSRKPKMGSLSSARRHNLAFVSPLPPARSGIADYSAELIPVLSAYYDIDLVVPDDFDHSKVDPKLKGHAKRIMSASHFAAEHQRYDRVLYHFGNSDHHLHMFGLLENIPGVVVLHDFFLSGIMSYWEHHLKNEHVWSQALYHSHGYQALAVMARPGALEHTMWTYPSNQSVLDGAQGIIVHSDNSRRLARQWAGEGTASRMVIIPHLRVPETKLDRAASRRRLGFAAEDIILCSFGIMAPTKHVRSILDAWLAAKASEDTRVHLVFVGQNDSGDYGKNIIETIGASDKKSRIRITGWTETAEFRDYLQVADVAIQLRTLSRGETSGTVLDSMNHALPIIVNANGSMADLPDDCVIKLDDEFEQADLIAAIDRLVSDTAFRGALGQRGRTLIETEHDPSTCAQLYRDAIERFAEKAMTSPEALATRIAQGPGGAIEEVDRISLAERLDWNAAAFNESKRILIEVGSAFVNGEMKRDEKLISTLKTIISDDLSPRIETIYWSGRLKKFCYARQMMLHILKLPSGILEDEIVDFRIGDVILDLSGDDLDEGRLTDLKMIQNRVFLDRYRFDTARKARRREAMSLPSGLERVTKQLSRAGWTMIDAGRD